MPVSKDHKRGGNNTNGPHYGNSKYSNNNRTHNNYYRREFFLDSPTWIESLFGFDSQLMLLFGVSASYRHYHPWKQLLSTFWENDVVYPTFKQLFHPELWNDIVEFKKQHKNKNISNDQTINKSNMKKNKIKPVLPLSFLPYHTLWYLMFNIWISTHTVHHPASHLLYRDSCDIYRPPSNNNNNNNNNNNQEQSNSQRFKFASRQQQHYHNLVWTKAFFLEVSFLAKTQASQIDNFVAFITYILHAIRLQYLKHVQTTINQYPSVYCPSHYELSEQEQQQQQQQKQQQQQQQQEIQETQEHQPTKEHNQISHQIINNNNTHNHFLSSAPTPEYFDLDMIL